MSAKDTYRIAHTAACKLQLAADRPDRNLRFILGHAFTLDKIRLQIAQIEEDDDSDEEDEANNNNIPSAPSPGVVSFPRSANRPVSSTRRRSPPPENHTHDISSDEDEEEEEEGEEDLRLERFGSAAGLPPRMMPDDGSDEEDEPPSPPGTPSKQELKVLTEGDGNEGLADMYQKVAGCPCHGHEAPAAEKVWDIPQKMEKEGPRLAVVQVAS